MAKTYLVRITIPDSRGEIVVAVTARNHKQAKQRVALEVLPKVVMIAQEKFEPFA